MKHSGNVKVNRKPTKDRGHVFPRWMQFAALLLLTFMITLTINYRAFTEYIAENEINTQLNESVQDITDENIALQEQIHSLKTDPRSIKREADKYGLKPNEEKVSKPTK